MRRSLGVLISVALRKQALSGVDALGKVTKVFGAMEPLSHPVVVGQDEHTAEEIQQIDVWQHHLELGALRARLLALRHRPEAAKERRTRNVRGVGRGRRVSARARARARGRTHSNHTNSIAP